MKIARPKIAHALLVFVAAAVVLAFMAAGTWAAGPGLGGNATKEKVLIAEHTFDYPAQDACLGKPRQLSITYHAVFDVGQSQPAEGRPIYWTALRETGSFMLLGAGAGEPSYKGAFSLVAGGPRARYTGPETFVVELTGLGSDGSSFHERIFQHVKLTDKGFETSFTTPTYDDHTLSCG